MHYIIHTNTTLAHIPTLPYTCHINTVIRQNHSNAYMLHFMVVRTDKHQERERQSGNMDRRTDTPTNSQ